MSHRIRIMGGSGSGKSTLADRLGQLLGIETVIHLDDIYWQPGWQQISYEELHRRLRIQLGDQNNWIIDGNYKSMSDELMHQTTDVVIIYPPLYRNLLRLVLRELVRASPIKFLSVTPPPLQVRDEPNDEPVWKAIKVLGEHAIRYYRYRARQLYQQFGKQFPQMKRHIYRDQMDLQKLVVSLSDSQTM